MRFLRQCLYTWKSFSLKDQMTPPSLKWKWKSLTLPSHGLHSPWNSPGRNTRVDSLSLLPGIFPTQGSNPGLPYCKQILYQLSHKGSPRILEWVAIPFSGGSSQPRNWTGVSCIAGGFFTITELSGKPLPLRGELKMCEGSFGCHRERELSAFSGGGQGC